MADNRWCGRRPALFIAALVAVVGSITVSAPASSAQTVHGVVKGNVVDSSGNPVAGARATLYESPSRRVRGPRVGRDRTNGRGNFRFVVDPGCYRIKLVSNGPNWEATGTKVKWIRTCVAAGEVTRGIGGTLVTAAPVGVVTVGTDASSSMAIGPVVAESSHGTRVYCPVSHFAHDDPIVNPGVAGGSHLHMFWGNTGADADSTTTSLLNSGRSTCEGGINNRSAYWIPALFNENDEVVLPNRVITYYKSFGVPDRSTIQPIPDGLQMLANGDVAGSGPWNFTIGVSNHGDSPGVSLGVRFPTCLAVDGNGQPILSSADNVSHLSYRSSGAANACPASHPYRIAGLSYSIDFPVDPDSDWYLASDGNGAKGSSLHGDYFAAWDDATMDALTDCNRESRNCDFAGGRGQLPERFFGPDGQQIYVGSLTLAPGVDTTPFGTTLRPMAG